MGQVPSDEPERMAVASERFLECDFAQCFIQMRRYEDLIWDTCKFTFTGYTASLGIAIGLYRYSTDKEVNLIPASIAVLGVALLLGVCFFTLIIRNRIYFVRVARYVNEHRGHFLGKMPLGFRNNSRMYTDSREPRFMRWTSSQLLVACVVALLNAVLVAAIVYILSTSTPYRLLIAIGALIITLSCELTPAIALLAWLDNANRIRENNNG